PGSAAGRGRSAWAVRPLGWSEVPEQRAQAGPQARLHNAGRAPSHLTRRARADQAQPQAGPEHVDPARADQAQE
ncbi:MAG TPA: hypothetical protein VGE11_09305, partial [Pseudonocardia sp.]